MSLIIICAHTGSNSWLSTETTPNSGASIVQKTWAERLNDKPELESDADEQLLMTIPWVSLIPHIYPTISSGCSIPFATRHKIPNPTNLTPHPLSPTPKLIRASTQLQRPSQRPLRPPLHSAYKLRPKDGKAIQEPRRFGFLNRVGVAPDSNHRSSAASTRRRCLWIAAESCPLERDYLCYAILRG
jgi:hypothetical protein